MSVVSAFAHAVWQRPVRLDVRGAYAPLMRVRLSGSALSLSARANRLQTDGVGRGEFRETEWGGIADCSQRKRTPTDAARLA